MTTQLESDFEEVLASMESMSDKDLATELREYRQMYSTSAKHRPRLGEVAFSFEEKPLSFSTMIAPKATMLSWSKLVSGFVLAAGVAFIAQRVALKIEEGGLTSNKYTPEQEPSLEAVSDEKSILIDQPDFGMVS